MPDIKAQGQQLVEALVGLGQLAGQSVGNAVGTVAKGPQIDGQNAIQMLGTLLGQASNIPAEQKLKQATTGTQTGQASEKPQLSAIEQIEEGVVKAVTKTAGEQASNAFLENGDLKGTMATLQQMLGKAKGGDPANVAPFAPGQQANQQPQQQTQPGSEFMNPKNNNPLVKLFEAFGFRESGASQLNNVNAALGRQELAGQKPLQAGEREKLGMESANALALELQKAGSVKALAPEAAGKFGLFMEGSQAVTDYATILEDSPSVLSVGNMPSFLKSQQGRRFNTALKRALSAKLRIESGGAITPEEIDEQWKTFAPKKTDDEETIRQKTTSLKQYFDRTMNIADPTGVHRKRAGGTNFNQSFTQTPGGNNFRVVQ